MKVFMGSVLRIFLFFFKQKTAYEILACGVQTCALPIFYLTEMNQWWSSLGSGTRKTLEVRGKSRVGFREPQGRHSFHADAFIQRPGGTGDVALCTAKIGRASCRERV